MSPEPTVPPAPDVDTTRLGKIRRLTRLASPDGFLLVAAMDHPENYVALFDPDVDTVPHCAVVESKLELAHALAEHCSALLLDPVFSLGQAVLTADLPGRTGMISSIELLSYRGDGQFGTDTALRPGWSAAKIAASGADAAKLFFSYRPELTVVAEQQRALVAGLAADCDRLQLPLVLEPLWYPLPGEDPADPAVQRARVEGIVAAAHEFATAADVLKVPFPGSVADEGSRTDALQACRRLDDRLDRPWVLLSAGVGFDQFADQVELAARAGASGYIAGRAIWSDTVGNLPDDARIAGLAEAGRRLERLNAIVREHGRPWRVPPPADRVAATVPADWHESFDTATSTL